MNNIHSTTQLSTKGGGVVLGRFISSVSLLLLALNFSGCSSVKSTGVAQNANAAIAGEEDDYRNTQHKLTRTLETPPDLFSPAYRRDNFDRVIAATDENQEYRFIPNYHAENISVKRNMDERWLEIKTGDTEAVWAGLEEYLELIGMKVIDARRDTGFMETEYLPRLERVPLDAMTMLTRAFNSWRPEVADGAIDKYIVQLEAEPSEKVVRVYFQHQMLMDTSSEYTEGGSAGNWRVAGFDPRLEAEALYEAMVFFGATRGEAAAQVKATEKLLVLETSESSEEKKKALEALILLSSKKASWRYLNRMVYRHNWSIDQKDPIRYSMVLNVPKEIQTRKGTGIWSDDQTILPSQVVIQLSDYKKNDQGEHQTLLKPYSYNEAFTLTPEGKRFIFQSLGLVKKEIKEQSSSEE